MHHSMTQILTALAVTLSHEHLLGYTLNLFNRYCWQLLCLWRGFSILAISGLGRSLTFHRRLLRHIVVLGLEPVASDTDHLVTAWLPAHLTQLSALVRGRHCIAQLLFGAHGLDHPERRQVRAHADVTVVQQNTSNLLLSVRHFERDRAFVVTCNLAGAVAERLHFSTINERRLLFDRRRAAIIKLNHAGHAQLLGKLYLQIVLAVPDQSAKFIEALHDFLFLLHRALGVLPRPSYLALRLARLVVVQVPLISDVFAYLTV